MLLPSVNSVEYIVALISRFKGRIIGVVETLPNTFEKIQRFLSTKGIFHKHCKSVFFNMMQNGVYNAM